MQQLILVQVFFSYLGFCVFTVWHVRSEQKGNMFCLREIYEPFYSCLGHITVNLK